MSVQLKCMPASMLAGMHDLLLAAVSHKGSVCRSYKNTMLRHVAEFLTGVKASLVKLGVDEGRLQRITQEVGTHHGLPRTAVYALPVKQMFVAICLLPDQLCMRTCCRLMLYSNLCRLGASLHLC